MRQARTGCLGNYLHHPRRSSRPGASTVSRRGTCRRAPWSSLVAEHQPASAADPDIQLAGTSVMPIDFGTHHCLNRAGVVQASYTRRAGPLIVRVTTSSRSERGLRRPRRAIEVQRKAHPELAWSSSPSRCGPMDRHRRLPRATGRDHADRRRPRRVWFRRFLVRDVYTTVLVDARRAELGRAGREGALARRYRSDSWPVVRMRRRAPIGMWSVNSAGSPRSLP